MALLVCLVQGGRVRASGVPETLRGLCLAGEAAAVDSEAVCQHVFTRVPSEHFHSPMLAFELVQFCRDSLSLLGGNLGILRLSFPNLFKARSLIPGPEWGRLAGEWGGLSLHGGPLGRPGLVTPGPRGR